jgi:hypothetical protein
VKRLADWAAAGFIFHLNKVSMKPAAAHIFRSADASAAAFPRLRHQLPSLAAGTPSLRAASWCPTDSPSRTASE